MAFDLLTLKMGRIFARRAVMQVAKRSYPTDQVDMALQQVLGDVMDEFKPLTVTATAALTLGAAGLNLDDAVGFERFHKSRLVAERPVEIGRTDATYPREPIAVKNEGVVADLLRKDTETGLPTVCCFRNDQLMEFHPIPDAAYPIDITFYDALVEWTPGLPQPFEGDEIKLNIPKRFILPGLWYGVAAALVFGEPDTVRGVDGQARYDAYLAKMRGSVSGVAAEEYEKDATQYQ